MLLLQEYMMIRRLIYKILRTIDDKEVKDFIVNEIEIIDNKIKAKRQGVFTKKSQRLLSGDGITIKAFNPDALEDLWEQ